MAARAGDNDADDDVAVAVAGDDDVVGGGQSVDVQRAPYVPARAAKVLQPKQQQQRVVVGGRLPKLDSEICRCCCWRERRYDDNPDEDVERIDSWMGARISKSLPDELMASDDSG